MFDTPPSPERESLLKITDITVDFIDKSKNINDIKLNVIYMSRLSLKVLLYEKGDLKTKIEIPNNIAARIACLLELKKEDGSNICNQAHFVAKIKGKSQDFVAYFEDGGWYGYWQ
jgi:hypothetical protein